jgi:class 3 adenylate cyclase
MASTTPHAAAPLPDVARNQLFANVDPSLIVSIEANCTVRSLVDGCVVCREGEAADHLFIVINGALCITSKGEKLAVRRAGEIVGEQAFIECTGRGATVVAEGGARVLAIPRSAVERLMHDAAFVRNLLYAVSRKLSDATEERAFQYRERRLLFSEFRAHVSPEVTQQLLESGEDYGQPRRTDAVILMADIRGFTTRSATMAPTVIAEQLTPYFDAVTTIVHNHGGMVDKFVGDMVMAVWGVVPAAGKLAEQALACAIEMVERAKAFPLGSDPIEIGVGLNYGNVFVGNVGKDGKRQFTVMGQPVNLTQRYESASKGLGAPIVMGPDFQAALGAEWLGQLTAHDLRGVKNLDGQTAYTFSPGSAPRATKG